MVSVGSSAATDHSLGWDPLVPLDNPYPVYRRMRDETPVYHHGERNVWALSRWDDVQGAAKGWEQLPSTHGRGARGEDVGPPPRTADEHRTEAHPSPQLFLPPEAGGAAPAPPLHTRLRGA